MSEDPQSNVSDLVARLPLPDTIADPYPLYEELRPLTPAFGYQDYPPGTVPGKDEPVTAWVLMQHEHVAAAARDHETFSSRDPLQEASSAPTLMLVNHDVPEHDRLRSLVNVAFSRREIVELKPWVLECASELLQGAAGRDCEVVSEIASVLPARVMMRLLGQPDEDAVACRDWATAFMLSADLSPEERQASNESMVAYFSDRVAELHQMAENGEPLPEGLISALLTAEVDGERLSLEEVIRFCLTLVVAGSETTTYLLANLLHNVAAMPEVATTLRADHERIPDFIEETLRHSGPPQRLFRIATKDVEVGGRTIHQGDWVALFFAAANHDAAVFPAPEEFDLDRANAGRHLTMGLGIHHCLGFAVAKLEAGALVEAVLDRFSRVTMADRAPVPQRASLLTHSFESLWLRFDD